MWTKLETNKFYRKKTLQKKSPLRCENSKNHWFHSLCGAGRRPGKILHLLLPSPIVFLYCKSDLDFQNDIFPFKKMHTTSKKPTIFSISVKLSPHMDQTLSTYGTFWIIHMWRKLTLSTYICVKKNTAVGTS